ACHGYGQLAEPFLGFLAPAMVPGRVVIAPEALSRFYLDSGTGRVGASWMTREARSREIDDYVTFLDAVRDAVLGDYTSAATLILGFSQGAATAFRWAVRMSTPPSRLVLWAGGVPPDEDADTVRAALAETAIILVTGEADKYATPAAIREDAERLTGLGLNVRVELFDGGHRLDKETFARI
ncbi:MAG: alpha/beta hydrolase, partial [Gemmatimonadales bacterium]